MRLNGIARASHALQNADLSSSKESTARRGRCCAPHPPRSNNLARPSLHRAAATAGTTFDAEGTLAPIIGAIVGIIGQVWRHGLLPDMRPPLDPVSASFQTGAVALATRFARCLSDGSVARSYDRTCGEKTDQKSSTHGVLLLGWIHRWLMNDRRPPHAQSRSALAFSGGLLSRANPQAEPQRRLWGWPTTNPSADGPRDRLDLRRKWPRRVGRRISPRTRVPVTAP